MERQAQKDSHEGRLLSYTEGRLLSYTEVATVEAEAAAKAEAMKQLLDEYTIADIEEYLASRRMEPVAQASPRELSTADEQQQVAQPSSQEQQAAEGESSIKKRRKRKKKKGKQPKAESTEPDWDDMDLEFERVKHNTQLHQDLRGQLSKKLSTRDEWNKKANDMRTNALKDLDMEAQMAALKLRGQAATMESKRHAAETKAYTLTYRRAMALDREVFALLKQIRELESDPTLKLDPSNMLNAAMRAAVEDDDPGKLKASLDQLHNPHLFRKDADKLIRSRPELEVMELKESIRRTRKLIEVDKEKALEEEKKKAAKRAGAVHAEEATK